MIDQTHATTLHYQMAYRVQDHAIDNSIPHKKDIPFVKIDSQKNSTTSVHVPKAVTREEMASLLPTTWITNYEKWFHHTKLLQSTEATFTLNSDKTVTIKFATPSVFPTQFMMQPMFTIQSTKFTMHHVLPKNNIDILNFQPSGQPVYVFTSSTGHCYWDLDCLCKACSKHRRKHSFYDDEDDDRSKKNHFPKSLFNKDMKMETLKLIFLVNHQENLTIMFFTPKEHPTHENLFLLNLLNQKLHLLLQNLNRFLSRRANQMVEHLLLLYNKCLKFI